MCISSINAFKSVPDAQRLLCSVPLWVLPARFVVHCTSPSQLHRLAGMTYLKNTKFWIIFCRHFMVLQPPWWCLFKGTAHAKMKIQSLSTHPRAEERSGKLRSPPNISGASQRCCNFLTIWNWWGLVSKHKMHTYIHFYWKNVRYMFNALLIKNVIILMCV